MQTKRKMTHLQPGKWWPGVPEDGWDRLPGSRRVLIASGAREEAEQLAELLRLSGFEVETAFHGAAALSQTRSFQPRVVIAALDLPDIDGFRLARYLRSASSSRRPVLVALLDNGVDLYDGCATFDYVLRQRG